MVKDLPCGIQLTAFMPEVVLRSGVNRNAKVLALVMENAARCLGPLAGPTLPYPASSTRERKRAISLRNDIDARTGRLRQRRRLPESGTHATSGDFHARANRPQWHVDRAAFYKGSQSGLGFPQAVPDLELSSSTPRARWRRVDAGHNDIVEITIMKRRRKRASIKLAQTFQARQENVADGPTGAREYVTRLTIET